MSKKNLFRRIRITRFHLLWALFYLLFAGGAAASAAYLFEKYDAGQLPSGYIELTLSKERYQLGEPVEFTVVNHFPTAVHVTNQCPGEPLNVYRWEQERWVQIHDIAKGEDSGCYKEPRTIVIPANGSRGYHFDDWPNLFARPGVYRIAMTVDHYDDIPFQDFVVLEPGGGENAPQIQAPSIPASPPVVPVPVIEYPEEEQYEEYEEYERGEDEYEEHEGEDD